MEVTNGFHEMAVVDGQHIRGKAGQDARRWNQYRPGGTRQAADQVEQQACGLETDALPGNCNARKRRMRHFADQFVVIDGNHGNVVWDPQSLMGAHFDENASQRIVGGEDSDRFGELAEPRDESALMTDPIFDEFARRAGAIVHPAEFVPAGREPFPEALFALVGVVAGLAPEAEMLETLVDQVLGRHSSNRYVVDVHARSARHAIVQWNDDRGQAQATDGIHEPRIFLVDQDSARFPEAQHLKDRGDRTLVIDVPEFPALVREGSHSGHEAADVCGTENAGNSIGCRGFHASGCP